MHMADALLAPAVATTMYVASSATTGVSIFKLNKEDKAIGEVSFKQLPTMAVMASLVFAGQMLNYTIPGTGSSGHICGGVILSAVLGPYAAFLSMISVLLIQCLFFADGGLMALGANVWNMAFYGCFVGYFLIYRPIMRSKLFNGNKASGRIKLSLAVILSTIITLQLGAFSVVLETLLSGITELPFGAFLGLMQPIHLAIGLVEGIATAVILNFVYSVRPELIKEVGEENAKTSRMSKASTLIVILVLAIVFAGGLSLLASSNPDGLEWSLFGNEEAGYSANMGLNEEDYGVTSSLAEAAQGIQDATAFMPDYAFASDEENPVGTSVAGVVGIGLVAVIVALMSAVGSMARKKKITA